MNDPDRDVGASGGPNESQPRKACPLSWRSWSISAIAKGIFAVCMIAGAAWVIDRQLQTASLRQVSEAIASTSSWALLVSIVAIAANYACLMASEWWALAVLNKALSIWRIALVTVVAYSASNALGFSLATGGAARLRFYSSWGLRGAEVAAVTLLAGLAVTLSGLVAAGLAILVSADLPPWIYAIGLALLTPAVMWLAPLPRSAPFFSRVKITTPPFRRRALALVGAMFEWGFNGLALFVLFPDPTPAQFAPFLAVFVMGSIISAASGAPGGIGVFEAVVLTLGGGFAPGAETAAALILFRLIYAVCPFTLVAISLAAYQGIDAIRRRRMTPPPAPDKVDRARYTRP